MVTARPAARAAAARAAGLLLAAALAGCGDGGPALHPVSGTAAFADGAPVAGAVVEFLPTAGGPAARGRTDADGRFALATGDRPGCVAGAHRVGVAQAVMMDGFGAHVRHMGNKQVVPPRVGSPATSGLTATVSADGPNDVTLVIDED